MTGEVVTQDYFNMTSGYVSPNVSTGYWPYQPYPTYVYPTYVYPQYLFWPDTTKVDKLEREVKKLKKRLRALEGA